MTIPLVIQAANASGAEWKDTQRRFVAQALLSTTDARDATAEKVGSRAFMLYVGGDLSGVPLLSRFKMQREFIDTARELLATKQTAPALSPHLVGFIAIVIAGWLVRKYT